MTKRRTSFIPTTLAPTSGFAYAMHAVDVLASENHAFTRVCVLAAVSKRSPRTLTDIARRAGLSEYDTRLALTSLRDHGLISPESERGYLRPEAAVTA